jgi:pimeloyl-ACP methyl ester carboxylesterase
MKPVAGTLEYLENLPPLTPPVFWQNRRGDRIAWNEYGDPAGGVMMFYHGWPSSRLQARAVHHLARERAIRVITLDRPGMGQSMWVRGRRLEDWGALVEEFADAHGIGRFAQLGVSGGGPYVLPCVERMPDRVAGSAVLCGAVPLGPHEDRKGLHPIYQAMIAMKWMPPACFSPAFKIGGWLAHGNLNRPPLAWLLASLPAEDREVLRGNPRAVPVFVASFEEGVRQGGIGVMTDADIYLKDWRLDWASIRQPIRYWHGGQDRNIPAGLVKKLVEKIPGARLQLDELEGHFSLALHRAPDAMDHLAACLAPTV